jgi:hypothetical protein
MWLARRLSAECAARSAQCAEKSEKTKPYSALVHLPKIPKQFRKAFSCDIGEVRVKELMTA